MKKANIYRYPLGIQTFEGLREDGYIYVDKTEYIYNLVHNSKQYFLSRPRRFGKSLLLSTIKAYWEGKKELFKGLKIFDLEESNPEAWQEFPVFYFDFNGKNYSEEGALEAVLNEHLERWEKIYNISGNDKSLDERFRRLIASVNEKTGLKVVILVDEYDKPLLETMENLGLEEHNKAVFKGFFGTLKSYDAYIKFVFITGVTKFNKVSIFSDLNQLNDISLDMDYSAICGITDSELDYFCKEAIEELAAIQNLKPDECREKLQKLYDGYHFHPNGDGIYNPFSLFKCFSSKDFGSYWFETGTPTFLVKKVKDNQFNVRKLSNCDLEVTEQELLDFRGENDDIIPLLYQTGYITIKSYNRDYRTYNLGFPNEEVKYGFLKSLVPEYMPSSIAGSGKSILEIRKYADEGDTEMMKNAFTALFASIPYTDKNISYEHYFQTVIYLVFTLLGEYTHCEVHSSLGRADCVLENWRHIYIFEFKMDESADVALKQIADKEYALPYKASNKKIHKIGVNFDSEKRKIVEWKELVGL